MSGLSKIIYKSLPTSKIGVVWSGKNKLNCTRIEIFIMRKPDVHLCFVIVGVYLTIRGSLAPSNTLFLPKGPKILDRGKSYDA